MRRWRAWDHARAEQRFLVKVIVEWWKKGQRRCQCRAYDSAALEDEGCSVHSRKGKRVQSHGVQPKMFPNY
eukprot:2190060-Pyramimonas_sp.AAC.1